MGSAFDAYLSALRRRTEAEAAVYARNEAVKSMLMRDAMERVAEYTKRRNELLRQEGQYKMWAVDAKLYRPDPDYVPTPIRKATDELKMVMERERTITSEIERLRKEMETAAPTGAEPAKSRAEERRRRQLGRELEKYEKELQRNRRKQQEITAAIEAFKSRPDYPQLVENEQWNDWLAKNPFFSETYYRLAKMMKEKDERASAMLRSLGADPLKALEFKRKIIEKMKERAERKKAEINRRFVDGKDREAALSLLDMTTGLMTETISRMRPDDALERVADENIYSQVVDTFMRAIENIPAAERRVSLFGAIGQIAKRFFGNEGENEASETSRMVLFNYLVETRIAPYIRQIMNAKEYSERQTLLLRMRVELETAIKDPKLAENAARWAEQRGIVRKPAQPQQPPPQQSQRQRNERQQSPEEKAKMVLQQGQAGGAGKGYQRR